jgi:hypothetical protein
MKPIPGGAITVMTARVAGPAPAGNRRRGTVDYEAALEPADEYGLDWWFRSVDHGAVLAWP